jgi:hypothetical protein
LLQGKNIALALIRFGSPGLGDVMRRKRVEREVYISRPSNSFHINRLYHVLGETRLSLVQILIGIQSTQHSEDRTRHKVTISLFFVSRSRTDMRRIGRIFGTPSRAQNIHCVCSFFGSFKSQGVVMKR